MGTVNDFVNQQGIHFAFRPEYTLLRLDSDMAARGIEIRLYDDKSGERNRLLYEHSLTNVAVKEGVGLGLYIVKEFADLLRGNREQRVSLEKVPYLRC